MIRLEILVLSIGKLNGCFDDPSSRAFKTRNPLLLKTYRPEKKCDGENIRIFSSFMGGVKSGISDILAKCDGKSNKLTPENNLRDLLKYYGFNLDLSARPITLFLRRSLDDSISLDTKLEFFLTEPEPEKVMTVGNAAGNTVETT